MRAVVLGLTAALLAGDAIAADYLRGSAIEEPPAQSYRWSGWYFGGQAAYANGTMNFSGSTRSVVADITRNSFLNVSDAAATAGDGFQVAKWPSLPSVGASAPAYGAFVGYNGQWGDVVLGVDAHYNITSLTGAADDTISRWQVIDSYRYLVTVNSNSSLKLTDYGAVRVRAGYAVGWVMPYAAVGFAVGRGDYTRSASVSFPVPDDLNPSAGRPLPPAFAVAKTEVKNGVFTTGYSLAGGVDIGLMPGVFIRGEYEFIQLSNIGGLPISINSFRTAAAFKF